MAFEVTSGRLIAENIPRSPCALERPIPLPGWLAEMGSELIRFYSRNTERHAFIVTPPQFLFTRSRAAPQSAVPSTYLSVQEYTLTPNSRSSTRS
jgi:hypothetical protein